MPSSSYSSYALVFLLVLRPRLFTRPTPSSLACIVIKSHRPSPLPITVTQARCLSAYSVASPPTLSPLRLLRHHQYYPYITAHIVLCQFTYSHSILIHYTLKSLTLKVVRFMFYCYYPFNPFASSSFHPLAYIGCWWDLRRDPSLSHLRIILVLGVFQGLCGV
jgi:hypothetical protein